MQHKTLRYWHKKSTLENFNAIWRESKTSIPVGIKQTLKLQYSSFHWNNCSFLAIPLRLSAPTTAQVRLARPLSVVLKSPIGRIDLFREVSDHGAAKTTSGAREQGTEADRSHSRVTIHSFVSSSGQMCQKKSRLTELSEKITDHLYYPQKYLKAPVWGLLALQRFTKSFFHPLRSRKKTCY